MFPNNERLRSIDNWGTWNNSYSINSNDQCMTYCLKPEIQIQTSKRKHGTEIHAWESMARSRGGTREQAPLARRPKPAFFSLAFLFLSGRENYKLLHSPGEATNMLLGNWNTLEILVEFTFFHFLLMVTAPQTEGVVKVRGLFYSAVVVQGGGEDTYWWQRPKAVHMDGQMCSRDQASKVAFMADPLSKSSIDLSIT